MVAIRWSAEMTSDVVGTLNPAFTDITLTEGEGTPAEQAARVIGWVTACQWAMGAADSRIVGLKLQNQPGGVVIPEPFPVTEYETLRAAFNVFAIAAVLPEMTTYGVHVNPSGTGSSSGRGDSVCVNTRASTAGKNGRGRNFIPFLKREVITSEGLLTDVTCATVETWYRWLFLGAGSGAPDSVAPLVFSPTEGTSAAVDIVQINRIPSRLRSRTK